MRSILVAGLAALCLVLAPHASAQDAPLKAGIIGLDTSHVVAFTKILNNPKKEGPLADVKIVAAFPAGSPDIPSSADRLAGFTKTLREEYQVEIVDSIDALLKKVDVVFLESVDGRPHLEQARPVLAAGKPLFIDKPVAGSLADALEIYALAEKHKTPCFSSSSLRFGAAMAAVKGDAKIGDIVGATIHAPCSLEPHHPDLFWYGVHGVEMLYTVLGTGCQTVSRTQTKGTDVVTGVWKDGRVGTFRGIREGKADYGGVAYGTKGIGPIGGYGGYEPLVVEVCKFFKSGKSPVSAEETIELFTFMEAADESKRQGGKPVTMESVLAKAKAELAARSK